MEKEALVIGTCFGQLLLHTVDVRFTEVVGQVDGGVRCISPSPDGDLLGIITGLGQMLVMTHDWDLLYETAIDDLPDGVDVRKGPFLFHYLSFFFRRLQFNLGYCMCWCHTPRILNFFRFLISYESLLGLYTLVEIVCTEMPV